ncbi:hypothetical protein NQ317_013113 [Molorchus minor]|uniref:Uncharacterized protein n=1 Tax=Molorchus minor TaxID=1323400 RepID=A0ABQ9JWV2_9CUCU|nr:hypothetical protein NQ317_013113 [Molorchus minor]
MYRSVTFSEIFSSTFSDDLNKYDSHDRTVKTKFAAKIGIGLIEFMLSSIFLSYGIIFSDCVKSQYYTPEDGLWTTILYTAAWNIASPWSRHICNYFERNKYSLFRYIIAAAVAFLFIGLIIPNQFLSFGVFGGIFSNLIYTQLKFIAIEKFDMDSKVFEANVQVARALTLLMLPHFMLLLVSYYTIFQVKLIFAAFLLNIFPAALIIKPPRSKQKYTEISRYQTLPAFSNQMREMMSFVSSSNSPEPLKSESSTEDDDDDDDDEKEIILPSIEHDAFYDNIIMNDQISHPTCLTPLTVETYYKNAGVSILPQILEENEIDNEIAASDSNKPHVVTTTIKEINTKSVIGEQNRRGSLEHYWCPEKFQMTL